MNALYLNRSFGYRSHAFVKPQLICTQGLCAPLHVKFKSKEKNEKRQSPLRRESNEPNSTYRDQQSAEEGRPLDSQLSAFPWSHTALWDGEDLNRQRWGKEESRLVKMGQITSGQTFPSASLNRLLLMERWPPTRRILEFGLEVYRNLKQADLQNELEELMGKAIQVTGVWAEQKQVVKVEIIRSDFFNYHMKRLCQCHGGCEGAGWGSAVLHPVESFSSLRPWWAQLFQQI